MAEGVSRTKLYLLVVLVLALIVLIFANYSKDCGTDQSCFNARAESCKRSSVTASNDNSVFLYELQGRRKSDEGDACIVKVTLLQLDETASPNLKNALEGKGMLCHIPKETLASTPLSEIENVSDFCTGPLKELLLQISLEKLYEVVVKNIGPLALEFSQSLSELNATS